MHKIAQILSYESPQVSKPLCAPVAVGHCGTLGRCGTVPWGCGTAGHRGRVAVGLWDIVTLGLWDSAVGAFPDPSPRRRAKGGPAPGVWTRGSGG